jgi:Kef-type K+ transport system membrane component KefB
MESLNPQNITVMLLSLAILIAIACILGELAQRLHQPAVLGELLAGILLGPIILGNISPDYNAWQDSNNVTPFSGSCVTKNQI